MKSVKTLLIFFCAQFFLHCALFSIAFAKDFRYDRQGKRDPFQMASTSGKSSSDEKGEVSHLRLEGVVIDPSGKSIAVVNGEMVGEGDRVGGVVLVKKIAKDGVTFDNNGEIFTIPIVKKE